jgi:hypothetical protein
MGKMKEKLKGFGIETEQVEEYGDGGGDNIDGFVDKQ